MDGSFETTRSLTLQTNNGSVNAKAILYNDIGTPTLMFAKTINGYVPHPSLSFRTPANHPFILEPSTLPLAPKKEDGIPYKNS
jgi:hypothetical protein